MTWILVVYLGGLPLGDAVLSRFFDEGPAQDIDQKLFLSIFSLLWPFFALIGSIVLAGWLFSQVVTPFEKLLWKLWPKKVDTKEGVS